MSLACAAWGNFSLSHSFSLLVVTLNLLRAKADGGSADVEMNNAAISHFLTYS